MRTLIYIHITAEKHRPVNSFPLLFTKKSNEYNPMYDISQTVKAIANYCLTSKQLVAFGSEKTGIIRSVIKACKLGNGADLKAALSQFNECMRKLKADGGFSSSESFGAAAEPAMVSHILEQAYARAVAAEAHLLNQYEGGLCVFSDMLTRANLKVTENM